MLVDHGNSNRYPTLYYSHGSYEGLRLGLHVSKRALIGITNREVMRWTSKDHRSRTYDLLRSTWHEDYICGACPKVDRSSCSTQHRLATLVYSAQYIPSLSLRLPASLHSVQDAPAKSAFSCLPCLRYRAVTSFLHQVSILLARSTPHFGRQYDSS